MEALIEYWQQFRITTAEEIRKSISEHLTKADKDLADAERELAKFESPDSPGTPQEQMTASQQELLAIQSQLASARMELSLARDRADAVRRLAREEAARPQGERSTALSPEVSALRSQKQALEIQIALLLQKKTPEHPDVKALKAQVEEIEKRLEEVPKEGGGEEAIAPPFRDQIMAAELDARTAQGKITALEARLRELSNKMPALRERARAYEKTVNRVEQARASRDGLLAQLRKVEAEITRLREAQDLEILDAPVLQPSPKTIRKFLLLFVAGGFMGIVLGSMLALLLRYTDITVKSELDVAQMLGKRTLAIIPRFDEVVVEKAEEGDGEEFGEAGATY
jgi:uncharacterized protein involved in exopolysaccharide biosynthesis